LQGRGTDTPKSQFLFSTNESNAAAELSARVSRLADRPKFNHHPAIIGHVRADTALRLFAGFRLFAKELIDLAQKQLNTIPRGTGTLPADESKTAAPGSTGANRGNRSVQP
jgi:hypothetical protein